jgi:hypothetical protein
MKRGKAKRQKFRFVMLIGRDDGQWRFLSQAREDKKKGQAKTG